MLVSDLFGLSKHEKRLLRLRLLINRRLFPILTRDPQGFLFQGSNIKLSSISCSGFHLLLDCTIERIDCSITQLNDEHLLIFVT